MRGNCDPKTGYSRAKLTHILAYAGREGWSFVIKLDVCPVIESIHAIDYVCRFAGRAQNSVRKVLDESHVDERTMFVKVYSYSLVVSTHAVAIVYLFACDALLLVWKVGHRQGRRRSYVFELRI